MKKFLIVALCLISVVSAKAQFSGSGSGTSDDPYQITNADELAEMSYFLGDTHKGTYFKVMNDIDLANWIEENNPSSGWNPIGVSSDRFKGILDGDNHTISGLYINRSSTDYIGFFGYVESGTISNLNITGSTVIGKNQTGGLVGEITSSSNISNCSITLNAEIGISGLGNIGGLVGNVNSSSLNNCEFVGSVLGTTGNVGGLIGRAESSSIISCFATANIECASSDCIGGIIGYSYKAVICTSDIHFGSVNGNNNVGGIIGYLNAGCTNVEVTSCHHSGSLSGTNDIGGIVGTCHSPYDSDTYSTSISKCISSGTFSGVDYIGGILGAETYSNGYKYIWNGSKTVQRFYYGYNNVTNINNCYSNANITGGSYIGGILGDKQCQGTITDNYSYGILNGSSMIGGVVGSLGLGSLSSNCAIITSIKATSNYGRICGSKSDGTIGALGSQSGNRAYSKCVITVDSIEQSVTEDELNGTGIGITALKNPNTYIGLGWDFDETWTINSGKTFPYLSWEKRVSSITLSKLEISLSIGETSTVVADVLPLDADIKDLVWNSSDETIAKVENGTVTAIAEGTVTITATAQDGSEMSASCLVTVSNTKDSNPADFDNVVYMENFAAELGNEVEVPILLKNQVDADITGFDFYLYLPVGLSPILDEDGYPIVTITAGRTTTRKHSIYGDIEDDGSLHIYTTATRSTYTFSGTEGEVASISIKVAEDAPNGVQRIVLRNVNIESLSEDDPYSVLRYNLSASIGKLSFGIADGNSLDIAQDKIYDEVTYSRTFSSANKWQALYVPFSIPFDTLKAYGLTVAELNDTHMYDTDGDGKLDQTTLEFQYVTSGATEANYPYLIKANEAGDINLVMKNTMLKAASSTQIECSTTRMIFKIKGTYSGVSGTDMYNNNYYAMGGGSLVRVASTEDALKPQRWYLSVENKDGTPIESYNAPTMRIVVGGMDIEETEETGIQNMTSSELAGKIYSIDGRVVNNVALKSGLYVKNNKKMIVR